MIERNRALGALPAAAVAIVLLSLPGRAGDWPMFRGDAARSAFTAEELPTELHLAWVRQCENAPAPAWPRVSRMTFDRVHQPVIAGGRIFYGDTVDGAVRAVELESGRQVWRFDTEGPIRFAPAIFEEQLFVASDDGFLYCLDHATGELRWKQRGGGDERLVLGNERMISRWPVRGGPVVKDGVLYYAAGIWPSEGIYIHALDARSGKALWVNDDSGTIFMAQPHGGAEAESGVGAQGHLVVTDEYLLVPNGRAVPAAFRRFDGAFEYFHLQSNSPRGGTETMASGKYFFNSGSFFDAKSGAPTGKTGAVAIAGLPDGIATATRTAISVYRWGEVDPATGTKGLVKIHEIACAETDGALIVAGGKLVAGGEGRVVVIDLEAGAIVWTHEVEGNARALAVSDGWLVVGTDAGRLYGFDGTDHPEPESVIAERPGSPGVPRVEEVLEWRIGPAALAIVEECGVREGYCLDIGGILASELARSSELHIIVVVPDAKHARATRTYFAAQGLLGTRVSVVTCPFDELRRLPSYFADLIVHSPLVWEDHPKPDLEELWRLQRPYGGWRCIFETEETTKTMWRGLLEDSGDWTHLYADPGNTSCSGDPVRGPLGMLWFREIAQDLPQRHGRGPSPLYSDGRIYSLGIDTLIAVDAYNGRLLWEHAFPGILAAYDGDHLMGVSGTHGLYCVSEAGVFVRQGARCHRLDRVSGEELRVYEVPGGESGLWGYLACEDGILFGTQANPEHTVTFRYVETGDVSVQLTESNSIFAFDIASGERLWLYEAQHSVRHNAIAIGGGRVHLVDRPLAEMDRVRENELDPENIPPHPPGTLYCLDARTGKRRWKVDEVLGTLLVLSAAHDSLLMAHQPTRFQLKSEAGGRMTVFGAQSGKPRWDEEVRYSMRPLVIDRTIYWQGGARDLLTGDVRPFDFHRSYGCGILAAGENMLVYRSATLGYHELERDEGTQNYGGIRPGCWINALPAGGLVLLPDASVGCVCSYLNRSWIALQPEALRWPTVEPDGGAYRKPVKVQLSAEGEGARVHYTLDGTTPTEDSPRYVRPVRVEESAMLKLRTFADEAFPSRVVSAEFVIDPLLLPLGEGNWSIWDRGPPVNSPPSAWRVSATGTVTQSSNIFSPIAETPEGAVQPLYGSLYVYEKGRSFRDGRLRLQLKSVDNDGIGVAFRYRDPEHHYLLSLNQERRFRTLAVRDGDEYRVIARDGVPYPIGQWFDVEVVMEGALLRVIIDGEVVFAVEDSTHRAGTIALHSWGSTGVEFRRIALER